MNIGKHRNLITNRRAKQGPDATVRLGDVLNELLVNRISPAQATLRSVDEAWSRLLPAELSQHCRIADISSGQLKVLVDSPPYMYELQLCSSDILRELQRQCPRARLRKIRLAIG